jgi:hypothetical protein
MLPFEDKVSVIFQLFSALHLAHRMIDFTHYDLHENNVLVKKLPHKVSIPYRNELGNYIVTRYIPIIIDFGFSHIVHLDKHYGAEAQGPVDYGSRMNRSFPLHDIFRFFFGVREQLSRHPVNYRLLFKLEEYFFLNSSKTFETFSIIKDLEKRNYGALPDLSISRY